MGSSGRSYVRDHGEPTPTPPRRRERHALTTTSGRGANRLSGPPWRPAPDDARYVSQPVLDSPPTQRSTPSPPSSASMPAPPSSASSPCSPDSTSLPLNAVRTSSPFPPESVS